MKVRVTFLALCLAASLLAGTNQSRQVYDPDHPGAWKMKNEILDPRLRAFQATAAESSLLSDRALALAEVARSAKVLSPPHGVEVLGLARYYTSLGDQGPFSNIDDDAPARARNPMVVELSLALSDYYHISDEPRSAPRFNPDVYTETRFLINGLGGVLPGDCLGAGGDRIYRFEDHRPICLKPLEAGRVGDHSVYVQRGDYLSYLFFTNGRPVWVTVTRLEFINIVLRGREAGLAQQRAELREQEKALGAERKTADEIRRDVEKMYAELEKDPAKREKLVADAVKTALAMQEMMFKSLEPGRKALAEAEKLMLDPVRQELERMTAAEKASAAWFATPPGAESGLVPAGAAGAREVVTLNPGYFEKDRPRSDIQLIVVILGIRGTGRPDPDETPSKLRTWELMHQLDWKRVAAFVPPAR